MSVADPRTGTLLDRRYRLFERVGEGGAGVVYRARHEAMDRTVAIKVLSHELFPGPVAFERFRREARAAGAIVHPNAVTIFDFGSTDITYLTLLVSNDTMRVSVTNTSYFGEQTVSTGPLAKGRWVHLAMTLKDRTCTLHVDGTVAASITTMDLAPYQLGDTTQNWLGRAQYWQDPYFNGRLQDFRIYGGALSTAQVQALAQG